MFAVGRGRQEHQPSLPPSINAQEQLLPGLKFGAAPHSFSPPPTLNCGAAKEEGGEKGSLLAESCMDGLSLHLAKGRRACSRSCSSLNDRMGERWASSAAAQQAHLAGLIKRFEH